MGTNMNLRMNDRRERTFEHLEAATGEKTTAGAIDVAARYYLRMAGDTGAYPTGAVEELMQLATDQGSVTADEIADVLDVDELPVEYGHEWSVGQD